MEKKIVFKEIKPSHHDFKNAVKMAPELKPILESTDPEHLKNIILEMRKEFIKAQTKLNQLTKEREETVIELNTLRDATRRNVEKLFEIKCSVSKLHFRNQNVLEVEK